jgi:SAM-dependent methyltransferase
MTLIHRVAGIAKYLRAGEPIYRWRSELSECPLCGKTVFISIAEEPFLIRCVRCRANITNLAIAQCIKQTIGSPHKLHAYEMSTYGSSFEFIKRNCESYVSSEYIPGRLPGEIVDGIRNEDAQNLSFREETFDIVTSNQVFEHVPDGLRAFRECHRVLKSGGLLIFTVPLYGTPTTERVATLENGKIDWLSTPEFHYSRTTGPNSVPVFWRYSSNDILGKLEEAGFSSCRLVPVYLCSKQSTPQPVVLAMK